RSELFWINSKMKSNGLYHNVYRRKVPGSNRLDFDPCFLAGYAGKFVVMVNNAYHSKEVFPMAVCCSIGCLDIHSYRQLLDIYLSIASFRKGNSCNVSCFLCP